MLKLQLKMSLSKKLQVHKKGLGGNMEFNRYVVVEAFKDLKADNHIYQKGDNYPFAGPVDPERVAELISTENKRGLALIELVTDQVEMPDEGPLSDELAKETTKAKKATPKTKKGDPNGEGNQG